MPEAHDTWSSRRLAGEILSLSGALCLVGALAAYLTGDEVYLRDGTSLRTHQDAAIVLGALGLILLVDAFLLVVLDRRPVAEDRRSDWD